MKSEELEIDINIINLMLNISFVLLYGTITIMGGVTHMIDILFIVSAFVIEKVYLYVSIFLKESVGNRYDLAVVWTSVLLVQILLFSIMLTQEVTHIGY